MGGLCPSSRWQAHFCGALRTPEAELSPEGFLSDGIAASFPPSHDTIAALACHCWVSHALLNLCPLGMSFSFPSTPTPKYFFI